MATFRNGPVLYLVLFWMTSDQHGVGSLGSDPSLPSCNIQKVSLTQKGYIQFLRYEVDVPKFQDFTLCLWMRTVNLTNPHPLFSYSLNGQRIIRSWLSPDGHLNLAIKEVYVMQVPLSIKLGRWYHICQSWSGARGDWQLLVNGKLRGIGGQWVLKGRVLPAGGVVVVGQEFTDFDKGLDDGIEGDVFGFNMATQWVEDPHGRRLAEDGYLRCTANRGSPVKKALISWANTPVRAYGGAIFSNARPVCGAF